MKDRCEVKAAGTTNTKTETTHRHTDLIGQLYWQRLKHFKENNKSHKIFGDKMSSTLFWFIFKENRLSDIVQHKEQQYSNKYVIRHERIDLQALITVKQALVLFLVYCTEAEEHSLVF